MQLHEIAATFLITIVVLRCLEAGAARLGLLDLPAGHKTHAAPTPVVGGIGMTASLLTVWLTEDYSPREVSLLAGVLPLLVLGVVDDVRHLRATTKLYLTSAVIVVALVPTGVLLRDLGGLWPGAEVATGALAVPLTVFAAVGLVNAFNLLDGVDGLSGTVALGALVWMLLLAVYVGADRHAAFAALAIAAVAGFLLFNLRLPGRLRARLFMGDAGSLVLGFVLVWLAITLSQRQSMEVAPVVMLWVLAVPIADTVATMVLRVREQRSVFAPGHDHIHHLLLQRGYGVNRAVLAIGAASVASGGVGVALWLLRVPDWVSLLGFLLCATTYLYHFLSAWQDLGRPVGLPRRTHREEAF